MKPKRNDPCHCGSGKKYKKCCLSKDTGPKQFKASVLSQGVGGIGGIVNQAFASNSQAISERKIQVVNPQKGSGLSE